MLTRYLTIALVVTACLLVGSMLFGSSTERAVLELASTPSGATVILNGEGAGYTTPLKVALRPATYKMELRHEGYQTARYTFEVLPGAAPFQARIDLVPVAPATPASAPR